MYVGQDEELPIFERIEFMFVNEDVLFFATLKWNTHCFNEHFHAYEVTSTIVTNVRCLTDLRDKIVFDLNFSVPKEGNVDTSHQFIVMRSLLFWIYICF